MAVKLLRIKRSVRIGAIAFLVLTLVGHVLIREWYRADLRYEIGGYYRAQGTAVASLKLQNHGRSDASLVKVSAGFPSSIRYLTTSDPMSKFEVLEGGIGSRRVMGRIDRVVPGQSLYLYIAVVDPSGPLTSEYTSFVSGISFAGGKARAGMTSRPFLAGFGWALIALTLVVVGLSLRKRKGSPSLLADIGPARGALKAAMGSLQGVIELANDVETLIRAGESLPKPFVDRFSRYKSDAAQLKQRLAAHAAAPEE